MQPVAARYAIYLKMGEKMLSKRNGKTSKRTVIEPRKGDREEVTKVGLS